MKMKFDVECTPEEARRFIGLPDLSPVHDAYVEKLQQMMSEGVTPDMVGDLVKSWGPMGEAGINLWTKMLGQMGDKK